MYQVVKRNGKAVPFDIGKIVIQNYKGGFFVCHFCKRLSSCGNCN